ncbi:multiple stress resistance protein BhsA [Franconibacter helveticus 513]|uniref:multiple stress resistance protein BhsA n=2 Tax=Franconibacter helveticus TaxID=357240 RepID=UPI00041F6DCD|nr:YdgH/BhsA/McbA-like domain containing protein [Franconibacter helveticus]MDU6923031.1 YdgH/BhsA/McbA-like domain containing protein [Franconibacter helveticus]
MKNVLSLCAGLAFATLSFSAFSAPQLLDNNQQLRPAGTVSAQGARNLDDLEEKLAEKARQEGAKAYVVESASGENHMFGTATIYK